LPDLPAGGGVQDFFLHQRWVVEQPEEAYLDDPADDCIPRRHVVDPVLGYDMMGVAVGN